MIFLIINCLLLLLLLCCWITDRILFSHTKKRRKDKKPEITVFKHCFDNYSTDTDFNNLELNTETKLALDCIVSEVSGRTPHNRLKLYLFLKNKISGKNREYFINKLFESSTTRAYFFDVVINTGIKVLEECNNLDSKNSKPKDGTQTYIRG